MRTYLNNLLVDRGRRERVGEQLPIGLFHVALDTCVHVGPSRILKPSRKCFEERGRCVVLPRSVFALLQERGDEADEIVSCPYDGRSVGGQCGLLVGGAVILGWRQPWAVVVRDS